jgi:hypothetical protein
MKKLLVGFVCIVLLVWPVNAWCQTPTSAPAPDAPTNQSTTSAGQSAVPADVQQAMQMPEGADKAKALVDAVKGWVQKDPATAAF